MYTRSLIHVFIKFRINDALATWKDEIIYEAAVEPPLDVVLDSKACQKAISELCFIQKSGKYPVNHL